RPIQRNCEKLAAIFSSLHSRMDWRWFHAPSREKFIEYLNSKPESVTFKIKDLDGNSNEIKNWLCGTYITYRYGFGSTSTDQVVREVLYIARPENDLPSDLQFRMSYPDRAADPRKGPFEFAGQVLPIDESLFFVGFSFSNASRDRACSLFLR